MNSNHHIEHFTFGRHQIQLAVPDEKAIQENYVLQQQQGLNPAFPYWAKLWPSSVALCNFINENSFLIKDKTVLELAAGLGLPSVFAAKFASRVISSDYAADTLPWINKSATLNNLSNIETQLIDWNSFPAGISADIVLLSDINYEPAAFNKLHELIVSLLQRKTGILLSTPQRLMAKPFIEKLLPYCSMQETLPVMLNGEQNDISVFYLS